MEPFSGRGRRSTRPACRATLGWTPRHAAPAFRASNIIDIADKVPKLMRQAAARVHSLSQHLTARTSSLSKMASAFVDVPQVRVLVDPMPMLLWAAPQGRPV